MEYILLIVGFVLLIKGADVFVDGSCSVARILKVPQFIIGLTVVSFGTSAPEAAVSISAGFAGSNEICLGNVIGSNMFNLLVVVGVCAAISAMPVERDIKRFDLPFSIFITAVVLALSIDKRLSRIDGLILVALFASYLFLTIRKAVKNKTAEEDDSKKLSAVKSIIFIVIGLAAVVVGGDMVVDNAVVIAEKLGMSQTLISLTIIAMGTSLPELVTSIVASAKGENGLALGNVVGSNIFNLLFVLAFSVTLNPVPVRLSSVIDLSILAAVSIIMLLMLFRKDKYSRHKGVFALLMYVAYAVYIFIRN